MKIAYVNQTYPPMITGVSHMLKNLASGMAKRGHTVLVIASSEHGKPYTIHEPGLTIVRLRSYQDPFSVGQRMIIWPKREIESVLKAFAPDVVHFHHPILAAMVRTKMTNLPSPPKILTSHLNPAVLGYHTGTPPFVTQQIERGVCAAAKQIFRGCDAVITPTDTIADYVAEMGAPRPEAISNGIDLSRFGRGEQISDEAVRLRRKYGLHPHWPVILHVGRLSKEKNVSALVRAVAQVIQKADAQLLIVGDGQELESLREYARDLGIADRVVFPGFVNPEDDLPGLYRLSTIFATTSEIETQGLVLLEAAASALPIVAVRAGAVPEIVHEGENGHLVNPGEEREMSDCLQALLQNPGRARSMGLAGRKIAATHALEKTFQAHERLYRTMIARRSASRRQALFTSAHS